MKVIKKENRKRRKAIEAYQQMINAGATGLHAVRASYTPQPQLCLDPLHVS